ncbi:catechol 1,2-dioxygenase-like protein [Phanerochaete sordida]|uniref:Catechol 1,2-dioxygenase-like protein n=1 Tax=Phanerochaete sordida TaxID=48140 RepID=A0A9P3G3C1_9APHY|nr:catechol 1,2-dioxygenase-like protein [Phanerochaete sordida]
MEDADDSPSSPKEVVTFSAKVLSRLLTVLAMFTYESPFLWHWLSGRKNPRADLAGPYHIIGAPDRQLEEGKALLATKKELETFTPFVLSLRVRRADGSAVPHATVDWWQADGAGRYSHATYRLRGTFATDAHGAASVLTVAPGKYGPAAHERAAHFHATLADPARAARPLTTQLYVCAGNDARELQPDFLNFVRAPRPANMLAAHAVGGACMGLPALRPDAPEARAALDWWAARLAARGVDASVRAWAQTELRLNA